jgi:putative DNA primase/helicase
MLPEVYRALVEDAAHRMQVPLDYPAAAGIVTLAGAVNRRCLMYPKQHDTSFVLAGNLWGITVGPPGRKKSPAADVMIAPLKRIDIGLRDNYERALENHKLEDERAQIRLTAWKEQIKRLDRDQYKDKPGGRVPSDEPPRPKMPEGPTCQKLITNDITVEKLQIRLAENPAGI